ncbi:MAG: hypothetical protein H7039_07910, partial [Bryobacteraceae bacterium]|nr:hypothetical protein [Bryobacteraceae bacterium]
MLLPGQDSHFALVRDLLERAVFTEATLCARLGISSLQNFEEEFEAAEMPSSTSDDVTGILIRLFVEGHYVDGNLMERQFGVDETQAMLALGLTKNSGNKVAASVALYPTAGVWIASDRWNSPDRTAYHTPADVVYPAIVSNAQRFLKFMPQTKCDSLLDLCSG